MWLGLTRDRAEVRSEVEIVDFLWPDAEVCFFVVDMRQVANAAAVADRGSPRPSKFSRSKCAQISEGCPRKRETGPAGGPHPKSLPRRRRPAGTPGQCAGPPAA